MNHILRCGVVVGIVALGACGIVLLVNRDRHYTQSGPSRLELSAAYEAAVRDLKSSDGAGHCRALREVATRAIAAGEIDAAERHARELLLRADELCDWREIDLAVHRAHVVLGEVALLRGDKAEACERLLDAGRVNGGPVLSTFGPDFGLARGLLASGEQKCVLEYLRLCGRFWIHERGRLGLWRDQIVAGSAPDFSAP